MEDILKQLYGDAVTEESLARFKEELGRKFVPKADFNQRGEELRMLREKLAEFEAAAAEKETLKQEKAMLSDELTHLKEQYEQEMVAAKQKEEALLLRYEIDGALKEAKARSLPAVRALINLEEISLKNGVLTGLSEQIALLKKEHGYLFEAGENNLQFIRPVGRNVALSSKDFQQMGYMEKLRLKKEQPDLYLALTQKNGGKK